jgi:hypothetical protein
VEPRRDLDFRRGTFGALLGLVIESVSSPAKRYRMAVRQRAFRIAGETLARHPADL